MKPYYGATNEHGQWFDGKTWRSLEVVRGVATFSVTSILQICETLRNHDAANCHTDGVFRCPRCWRKHFICDTYDYLCDGCVSALLIHTNTPPEVLAGIAEWKVKRGNHLTDPDIAAKMKERQELSEAPG